MITEAPAEQVMETPAPHADHAAHAPVTPQEAMGHGGHHAAMSMDDMVRDMRNRFLVAALLSIPILLAPGWARNGEFCLRTPPR
jgi:hypothetical protein